MAGKRKKDLIDLLKKSFSELLEIKVRNARNNFLIFRQELNLILRKRMDRIITRGPPFVGFFLRKFSR